MIRSLTIGLPIGEMSLESIEKRTLDFIANVKSECKKRDVEIRTIRFTLPPASAESEKLEGADLVTLLDWVDRLAVKAGVRWYCLPLDFSDESIRNSRLEISLRAVRKYPKLFLNLIVSNGKSVSLGGVYDASKLVLDIGRASRNGFDNFRVGISSGVPANSPFFPSSMHEGPDLRFSFAIETVPLSISSLETEIQSGTQTVFRLREALTATLTSKLSVLDELGKEMEEGSPFVYSGLDASFAPMPGAEHSVVNLLRKFRPHGDTTWGGFLSATSLVTDIIRDSIVRSGAKSTGFNGVMFSVLEDSVLAEAVSRREVDISYLTALSAVCGCGIDMVPVPEATFPEEIAAIVLDICAISLSLGKPLGVRLLPIPGALVGDYTAFSMDFLCDSRVLEPPRSSGNFISQKETLVLGFPLRAGWRGDRD